ncbi:MAG TPA: glycoside hydrolase family 9 protein [Thermoanaerobaculia bacterium]|nr:glycoside hydrolase family 9 protein [Thermoanaerobaculia bacterium]
MRGPLPQAGEGTPAPLLRTLVRAYHGQRCGTAVDLGGGYRYEACHLRGGFHPSSGRSEGDAPAGGWHDAGDYGRYVVNSGITVGTLLWAWELFPRQFEDIDLLGEVRWNLEWMLAMQDDDGGVWHKQTPKEFPPFVMPHEDESISYVIGKGSCATANLAAVAAIAARVYAPHDEAFAQRNRDAAARAWLWLEKHPNVRFRNPPDVSTGEYGDKDCSDERLWVAAEVWRSTSDARAGDYLRRNIRKAATGPASWSQTGPLALWSHALSGDPEARRRTIAAADRVVERAGKNPWRIPMTTRDYVWGSNAVAANYGMQLLVANELRPDPRYVETSRHILRYLLGNNPFSISWVTGFGARSVQHPHHRPSGSDAIDAPWPGLLAGGPNRNRQDPVLKKLPRTTPPMLMYADDQESYAGNEVAINWNAPLVFLVAGLQEAEGGEK